MSLPPVLQDSLRLPIVASPMFIVSQPDLVCAQCQSGIVGSFPALNARSPEILDEWLTEIAERNAAFAKANPDKKVAPVAVNQICHATNTRVPADMEVCVKHKVPIIITSLRPPEEVVTAVHSYGGVVFHDVINERHARKAVEQGVDGLILVAAGAGGHAGAYSPFALVQDIREWFDGTILLSGSISTGNNVLAAQAMGADLAYIGSTFIATEEAIAAPEYKQMIVDCNGKDIVYTNLFSGVPGNYLKPSVAANDLDPDNLPVSDKSAMNFGSGGNTEARVWKDIWGAGQGIGQVKSVVPTADVLDRIEREYLEAKKSLA